MQNDTGFFSFGDLEILSIAIATVIIYKEDKRKKDKLGT
ncbi:MAG: hypothetical protein ACI94Y_004501 [Maribacter sp.]|jgi:hypothetical protein